MMNSCITINLKYHNPLPYSYLPSPSPTKIPITSSFSLLPPSPPNYGNNLPLAHPFSLGWCGTACDMASSTATSLCNRHNPTTFALMLSLFAASVVAAAHHPTFREAPAFRNGDECSPSHRVDIAMTLDANYLRGTMAAVLSILQHTSCPENVAFHFLSARFEPDIISAINSTFPYLDFKLYRFDSNRVRHRISRSIRHALDQPLNYARIYLADILPLDVARIIYLDSDVVVVDDVRRLWEVDLGPHIVGAPEYCHANFTNYFTDAFWLDRDLARTFEGRKPCYFNTGVMVMDVDKWRQGNYTKMVEDWMGVQKQKRIYHLGSLPPFLLVLAGNIKAVDHRWNQHGLGGDNIEGKCRNLHPGPISLLHWSGKGKPWLRLDSKKPCSVDHLWAPYDLYRTSSHSLEE